MFSLSSKYFSVFKNIEIYILLSKTEQYINGAILQIERIERTRRLMEKKRSKPLEQKNVTLLLPKLFLDAHFYFICVGQVNKFFKRLCDELKNPNLDKVYSEFKKVFKSEIRNDLEHLDERVVGKKFGKAVNEELKKRWLQDFVNFRDDRLSFGGKLYPVNKEALKNLKGIYKNLISVIHKDYAMKNSNFVEWENREKIINKITRLVEKKFLK